jgi:hypothetical protein
MADVLRSLGLPQNGGSHAHLRRRIDGHGIDTSHFRRPVPTGVARARPRSPAGVLVVRDPKGRRAHPDVLRRAMAAIGLPTACGACGIGSSWNGQPLTLHVDHINGRFWDCRAANLRLLCPNCHSQTPTYAGRNRRIFGVPDDAAGGIADGSSHGLLADGETSATASPVTETELISLISQVDARALTTTEAARRIGCDRGHLHRIRQRLQTTGAVQPRADGRRWRSAAVRETVLRYALANPDLGPKRVAANVRELPEGGCAVSHGTVSNILREAGLNTVAARRSRLSEASGSGGSG